MTDDDLASVAIRDALRDQAALITSDTLANRPGVAPRADDRPAARGAAARRIPRWAPALAAAAVVAALAVGIAAVAERSDSGDNGTNPADGGSTTFYLGHDWRLISVTHAGRTVTVPTSVGAGVDFSARGKFTANDSESTINGTLTTSATGFDVGDWTTSGTGYPGAPSAAHTAAVDGIDHVLVGADIGAASSDPQKFDAATPVTVSRNGPNLVLSALGYRLELEPADTRTASAYVGKNWRIVSVTHGGSTTDIPSRIDAVVTFGTDGRFDGGDGVNAVSGHYRRTGDGFETSDVAATAAGYIGHDPAILAAVEGYGAVLEGVNQKPPYHVTVAWHGSDLALSVPGYQVVFAYAGTAKHPIPASTSATPTGAPTS